VIADDTVLSGRPTSGQECAPFEKERGVTAVSAKGPYSYLRVDLSPSRNRAEQELAVYRLLSERQVSVNLVKLDRTGLCFVVDERQAGDAQAALAELGLGAECAPSVSMVCVYAAGMRGLSGVMARIAGALLQAQVPILQTGDGPDTVFVLVDASLTETAIEALRREFRVPAPEPGIVVQKFGGKSVGTAEARRLAAERVREAFDAGLRPVVVVSAIGRRGEPYATDTLLSELEAVDPNTDPAPRERDLLMACGEIISTVIMAQTLKAIGLRAVALTGGQAGITTDPRYGDAQILDIDPTCIRHLLLESGNVDVVVVAGFQGVTEDGAITTLGRGGSDTTASALGAALSAEKVEIYTHVDGVMTADPEMVPDARTLPMVTYEEVANMAHQGAKVIHPRAAEIAMLHQIPLWVKSSFVRAPGTRIAPLAELQPQVRRPVTGVANTSRLVYFTLSLPDPAVRAAVEHRVYRAVGEAGINFYLNSVGPDTSSFLVDQAFSAKTETILAELGVAYERTPECEMVSVVALHMWDEPGLLQRIAQSLFDAGIPMLQMADSEGTVSCLVSMASAGRAAKALHDEFGLGG
jgi:aspartate kinase